MANEERLDGGSWLVGCFGFLICSGFFVAGALVAFSNFGWFNALVPPLQLLIAGVAGWAVYLTIIFLWYPSFEDGGDNG